MKIKQKVDTVLLGILMILIFSVSSMAAETAEQIQNEVMARVNAVTDVTTAQMQYGAAMVMDPVTGNAIYEYEADKRMYPASTTKIMSFVLIYEGLAKGTYHLDDVITISPGVEAVEEGDIKLVAGQTVTLQEMLYAMSIISANDASVAVAEYVAGSEAAYVDLMNAKAAELGMKDTHFANCTGLHDETHYSTARDLSKLATHAYTLEGLLDLTSVKSHTFSLTTGQITAFNTNKLLFWYPGTDGLKTGFTTPAGRCLVGTAVKNNMRLISVVLGGTGNYSHYSESMILLNYGFSKYENKNAVTAGEECATVDVEKAKVEAVKVASEETLVIPTAKEGDPGYTIEYRVKPSAVAPVEKGAVIGKVVVVAKEKEIASADMICLVNVEKENIFQTVFRFFRDLIDKI